LISIVGDDNVYNYALDRTATAKTATGGISQELSKDWQANFDATIARYSGTPDSGVKVVDISGITLTDIVRGVPSPGIEYYASASLNGANVFRESDSMSFGLRYSGSKTSNYYLADAAYRFPVGENLRMTTRLSFNMRDSKTSDQKVYRLAPSVASRYRLNKMWSFESEVGLIWDDTVTPLGSNQTLNVRATAGYRFEF
jgi:hypothetical protein